jgi:hypothetical protein
MIIANSCLSFFPRSDYINPIDLCNRLNAYIIPEAAVHAFLTFLFVINGYWLAIVLNLPLLAFNAKKYVPPILADTGFRIPYPGSKRLISWVSFLEI